MAVGNRLRRSCEDLPGARLKGGCAGGPLLVALENIPGQRGGLAVEALELFKEGAPGDAHLFADRLKIELGDGQGSVEVEDECFRRRRWVATRLQLLSFPGWSSRLS